MTGTVGVVGFGLLGRAIAGRLLEAGYSILATDANPARMSDPMGGAEAVSIDELAHRAATFLIIVYSADDVRDVIDALAGVGSNARGRSIICITTLSPEDAVEIEARVQQMGFAFVEFPLSGTAAHARAGEALGLAGGSDSSIALQTQLLNAITGSWIVAGRAGEASKLKLVINLVLEISRAALAEGVAFGRHLGIADDLIGATLPKSAARSSVMASKLDKMLSGDFSAEARLRQSLKDLELIERLGAAQDMPMAAAAQALLAEAVAQGHGEQDSSAVLKVYQRQSRLSACASC